VNASGQIVLANSRGGNVIEVQPDGTHKVVLNIQSPEGVAIDNAGNVYVLEKNSVVKVTPAGVQTTIALPTNGPYGGFAMTFDQAGNLYTSNSEYGTIVEIPANGSAPFIVSNVFGNTYGIAVDTNGLIYVADPDNSQIGVVTPHGIGSIAPSNVDMSTVESVAVDAQGNVYFGSHFCQRLLPTPVCNYYLKMASPPDFATAVDIAAGQSAADALAMTAQGNLLILDASNVYEYDLGLANFGTIPVGQTSATTKLTFTAGPNSPAQASYEFANSGIPFTGDFILDPTVVSGYCDDSTGYNTTCYDNYQFSPSTAGVKGGEESYWTLRPNAVALERLPLVGTATAPQAVLEPAAVNQLTANAVAGEGYAQSVVDGLGNVFVANPTANSVQLITAAGAVSTVSLPGYTLNNPNGVALGPDGRLYIADTGNNRVLSVPGLDPPSAYITAEYPMPIEVLDLGGLSLSSPMGLAFDAFDNLYIADEGNSRVVEVNRAFGQVSVVPGYFPQVVGIAVDGSQALYLTSDMAAAPYVWKVLPGTGAATVIATPGFRLDRPTGIAVDAAGTIYIADDAQGVVEVHPDGTAAVLQAEMAGVPVGGVLSRADSVALDALGNVYVANPGPSALWKLDRTSSAAGGLSFLSVKAGAISPDSPKTASLHNVGNLPMTISAVSYPADFPENTTDTNLCAATTVLAPGGSCDFSAAFVPTGVSSFSESITVTDNALNEPAARQTIGATGTSTLNGQSQSLILSTRTPSYPLGQSFLLYYGDSAGLPVTLTVTSGEATFPGGGTQYVGSTQAAQAGVTPKSGVQVTILGPDPITIVATQPGNSSYEAAAPVNTTITVTPATVMPRLPSGTQVYGETPVLTYTLPGLQAGFTQVSLAVVSGVTPTSPVGTYTVTLGLTGPDAQYYTLGANTAKVTVTPAPLTIAANDVYLLQGSAIPTLTVTATGLVGSDTLASLGLTPTLSTTATATSAAGSYPITVGTGTLAATNYTVTTANGYVNLVAPITVPTGAVNASSGAVVNVSLGAANRLASQVATTLGTTRRLFSAPALACAGSSCNLQVNFTAATPGTWHGVLTLYDNAQPANVLLAIPVTATATAPWAAFSPAAETVPVTGLQFDGAVAVDRLGNLFVTDFDAGAVYEYAPGSNAPTTLASGLGSPWGLALDAAGDVFVSEYANGDVLKIPAGGGTPVPVASGFSRPAGIALDAAGNLYVANYGVGNVIEVAANGGAQTTIGSGIIQAAGVAVDGLGDVFIADASGLDVVEVLANGGGQVVVPATGLNTVYGVTVDAVGNVYIADTSYNRIVEVPANGGPQFTLASGLKYPYAVAVGADGTVYAADTGNGRVVAINPYQAPTLNFATTTLGATSPDSPQSVTVVNLGNAPLTLSALNVGANFAQVAGSGTPAVCTATSSLTAGASCNVSLSFTPATAATIQATAVLTDNSLNGTGAQQSITLNGTGVVSTITVSPGSLVFGSQAVGTYSGNSLLNLSNSGNTDVQLSGITITGPNASSFVTSNDCSGTVMANYGCVVVVRLHPAQTGPLSATLVIKEASPGGSQMVALSGTGTAATPVLSWKTPAAIPYGTALSALQLDATANVPGTFVYSPAKGAVLAGGTQTLSVTFTPTDTVDYTTATGTVQLTVTPSKAKITWAAPSGIVYGTALSAKQLDATANVAGTFAYSPALGTVLTAGTQTLSVTFTPTNAADSSAATATVQLVVTPAAPKITWPSPLPIEYGNLSSLQLNATANVPGTFSYSPNASSYLPVGTQILTATFTPTDTVDYRVATATQTIVIQKRPLLVTAANATRAYGQPNPVFTATISGFVEGDTAAVVSGAPSFQTNAVPASPLGSYPILVSVGTLTAQNYSFRFTSGLLTLSKGTATAGLTVTPNPVAKGAAVTLTATVAGVGTGAVPTGTVNFYAGGTLLGSGTLTAGVAKYSVSTLSAGTHTITATYVGNGDYLSAAAAGVKLTVQ
jgi:sugar lactone lactonase YvrE